MGLKHTDTNKPKNIFQISTKKII